MTSEEGLASQRRVARYILENGRQVAFLTAQELAAEVGVSLATVVRTAANLGFGNYYNLRGKLKEILMASTTPTWLELEKSWEKHAERNFFDRIVKENIESLRKLLAPETATSIDRAVDLLDQAESIYVMGSRSSRAPALTLYFAFQQFLWNTHLLGEMGEDDLYENLLGIDGNDVFIAISHGYPYYAVQTINAVKLASSRGIRVILLTDHPSNPCVMHSSVTIVVYGCEGHFSLVPLNTVLESLIVGLGMRRSEKAIDKLRTLWKTLIDNGVTLGREN
ncbi:MAG: MurR/RpiR family transcriptional regulator [Thermovirgaceae bacterium]